MKKSIYYFTVLFALLVVFSSCKKKDDSIKFSMRFVKTFEVGAGLDPFFAHYYVIHDINSLLENQLSAKGLSFSDLISINPQEAQIFSLISNIDYDFIKDISVIAETTDGSISKEVFYRENIPFSVSTEINLLPTLVDVKEIFKEEEFDIKIKLILGEISPYNVPSKIDMEFVAKH